MRKIQSWQRHRFAGWVAKTFRWETVPARELHWKNTAFAADLLNKNVETILKKTVIQPFDNPP